MEFRRLRAHGIPSEALENRRKRMVEIRPIESDAAMFEMLARASLVAPRPIFVSLQFKVFLTRFDPGGNR